MREIKFRAWLKDKMEMCEVLMINFQKSYIGVKTKDYNIIQVGISWKYTQKVARFDDVELMQYTGIKDKNGKEIYEGDIVRHKTFGIKDISWGSKAENNLFSDMACFMFNGTIAFLSGSESKEIEVIGNIFEDGDLIANR